MFSTGNIFSGSFYCDEVLLDVCFASLSVAGTTPLYFAAQEGRLATLKYLHEKAKCDLSSRSNDGRKPIHAACQCGHTHIVKVFTLGVQVYSFCKERAVCVASQSGCSTYLQAYNITHIVFTDKVYIQRRKTRDQQERDKCVYSDKWWVRV